MTSVCWTQRGNHLSVGSSNGEVYIWDTVNANLLRTLSGHSGRVGTMAWSSGCLASGSRDRLILLRDVRTPENYTSKFIGHKQEVIIYNRIYIHIIMAVARLLPKR